MKATCWAGVPTATLQVARSGLFHTGRVGMSEGADNFGGWNVIEGFARLEAFARARAKPTCPRVPTRWGRLVSKLFHATLKTTLGRLSQQSAHLWVADDPPAVPRKRRIGSIPRRLTRPIPNPRK